MILKIGHKVGNRHTCSNVRDKTVRARYWINVRGNEKFGLASDLRNLCPNISENFV